MIVRGFEKCLHNYQLKANLHTYCIMSSKNIKITFLTSNIHFDVNPFFQFCCSLRI